MQREGNVSSLVDVGAFWAMIDEIRVCILVTRHGEALRGRPMGSVANRKLGEIHFLTRPSSHKAYEISDMGFVNLAFIDRTGEHFLSVSGTARISDDRAMIRSLWDGDADKWFPEGADGPDVAIVRVKPDQAEYWDAAGGARKYAWLDLCQIAGSAPIR
jgi:general stress protein 26